MSRKEEALDSDAKSQPLKEDLDVEGSETASSHGEGSLLPSPIKLLIKRKQLIDYLINLHDCKKGSVFGPNLSEEDLILGYESLNKKRAFAWFNLGYCVGEILDTADPLEFLTQFNALLVEYEQETYGVLGKRILSVSTSWNLKRLSRNSIPGIENIMGSSGSEKNQFNLSHPPLPMRPDFYQTTCPCLKILSLACDKIINQSDSTLVETEKCKDIASSINLRLKKLTEILVKEVYQRGKSIVEEEVMDLASNLFEVKNTI